MCGREEEGTSHFSLVRMLALLDRPTPNSPSPTTIQLSVTVKDRKEHSLDVLYA
jgi:hypothetical protein